MKDYCTLTHQDSRLEIQVMWPHVKINRQEFFIGLDTCIRIVKDVYPYSYGFGLNFLGFGMGIALKSKT
jgi:hypothetical protein